MNRRLFLESVFIILAVSLMSAFLGGCIAPLISPEVAQQQSQAWRCGNCGHLTRSPQDLTNTRCPRCKRKGFLAKISEKELRDYINLYQTSRG